VQRIREKSAVLHLGIDLRAHDQFARQDGPRTYRVRAQAPIVLWNQRWEYDKNPDAFFRLMNRLDDAGCTFQLILAGERFEEQPYEFERAFERYAERILHYGYAEDFAEYSSLLHRANIIVSTAIHEFFGIAVLEAIYCGCHPLLPYRLSYPELIPDSLKKPLLHAPTLYEDEESLYRILYHILKGDERTLPLETLHEICEQLDWRNHVGHYDDLIEEVVQQRANVTVE
jgi:glycosyltransferase involved in cell wall biosynthesis